MQETTKSQLVINKLTRNQYSVTPQVDGELYFITDDKVKADIVTNLSATNPTIKELAYNTIYQYGTIDSLTIKSLPSDYATSNNKLCETIVYFTVGTNGTPLTITEDLTWSAGNAPYLKPGTRYAFYICNGLISCRPYPAFVPSSEKHVVTNRTYTLNLDTTLDDSCYIKVYRNGLSQIERENILDTVYDFYTETNNGTTTLTFTDELEVNDKIYIDIFYTGIKIEKKPAVLFDLTYPYTDYTQYLTNVTGGDYPFEINSTKDCLQSGSTSYHIGYGLSWGMIQFTTPNNINCKLAVESYTNCGEYDRAACIVALTDDPVLKSPYTTPNLVHPTDTNYGMGIYSATQESDLTNLTVDNPVVIYKTNGLHNAFDRVEVMLSPNTTYYLHLIYKKSYSGNTGGEDRFYVRRVTLTAESEAS